MPVGNPRLLVFKPGKVKVQILFGNKEFKVILSQNKIQTELRQGQSSVLQVNLVVLSFLI